MSIKSQRIPKSTKYYWQSQKALWIPNSLRQSQNVTKGWSLKFVLFSFFLSLFFQIKSLVRVILYEFSLWLLKKWSPWKWLIKQNDFNYWFHLKKRDWKNAKSTNFKDHRLVSYTILFTMEGRHSHYWEFFGHTLSCRLWTIITMKLKRVIFYSCS